ncbi:MAG: YppG family protein [Bacillus sp. (in: firmicutes)]
MMGPNPNYRPMPDIYYDISFDRQQPGAGYPYQMYGPPFPSSMPYYHGDMYPSPDMQHMQQPIKQPMPEMFPYGQGMYHAGQLPPGYQSRPPYMPSGNSSPFANPLQSPKAQQQMAAQYPNPYPKQASMQKQQPSGFKSIMNQFKTQDGSVDVTKMMNTAGQMMGTVNQVQSMFKGLGSFFKAT